MASFTFKKEKRGFTSEADSTTVKMGGRWVGNIIDTRDILEGVIIRLAVKDSSTRIGWRWITLKYRPDTEAEARAFLLERQDFIQRKYTLHQL